MHVVVDMSRIGKGKTTDGGDDSQAQWQGGVGMGGLLRCDTKKHALLPIAVEVSGRIAATAELS